MFRQKGKEKEKEKNPIIGIGKANLVKQNLTPSSRTKSIFILLKQKIQVGER